MSAKEKAIEVCGAMPIARHINDGRFSVGWYTDRLYETGVDSKVDDEGLFFWADTGYDDRWEWENRPYSRGLMHAFHQELAAVLCEGIPLQEISFSTPESELQVLRQMFSRVTINGQALLSGTGGNTYVPVGYTHMPVDNPRMAICLETYVPVSNPRMAIYLEAVKAIKFTNGIMVRLRNNAGRVVYKVLTGEICDDMYDLLIGLFDMIDLGYD